MKNIVLQAISATLTDPEGQEWLEGIYRKISSEGGTGSYLPMTPEEVEETIKSAEWEVETTDHERNSIILFTHGIKGFYNMRSLEDLPDDAELVVAKFHGDKPQLAWVSDDYKGTPTDELRAIVGIDETGTVTFFITAYPGPAIMPEDIEAPEQFLGKKITVAEARRFGATYCKVVTEEAVEKALAK